MGKPLIDSKFQEIKLRKCENVYYSVGMCE